MADDGSEGDYAASDDDGPSSVSSHQGSLNASATQGRTIHHQRKPNQRSARGHLSKNYRDLLNIEIEGVQRRAQTTSLDASQIGASRWTSHEKELLFQSLASRGPDNLQALGRAVGTKSEQEIRVYLLLLQAGGIAQASRQINLPKQSVFTHDDVLAAVEISADCEQALDLAADALAAHVEKHLSERQREEFGDDWLVDANVAEHMDSLQEQTQPETGLTTEKFPEKDEADLKDSHSDAPFDTSFDALLRPSAFLRLSRNIYMNNGEDGKLNWHHVDPISTDPMEPVLFRSTLEDLRNIVVSITRRAVQATIFQATSRLRAEDASRKDWSPLGAIREVDVRTAVGLLNLPQDSKTYWATVARRCRVGVFSDSIKYADGRPSTKSGHHLTYEEVEHELGLGSVKHSSFYENLEAQGHDEDDIDELMDDSDLFTEEDSISSASETYREARDQTMKKTLNTRKRTITPDSSLRAETSHLQALDEVASVREEKRLWELLRRDPPEDITMDRKRPTGKDPIKSLGDSGGDWRAQLNYESDWEQVIGRPATKQFKYIHALGMAGRAERETLLEEVQRRLDMDPDHDELANGTIAGKEDNSGDEEHDQK